MSKPFVVVEVSGGVADVVYEPKEVGPTLVIDWDNINGMEQHLIELLENGAAETALATLGDLRITETMVRSVGVTETADQLAKVIEHLEGVIDLFLDKPTVLTRSSNQPEYAI